MRSSMNHKNEKSMKTRILSIFSVAALLFAGCYEDAGETGIDESTRISLSPSEISFTPDGTTADGEVSYVGVVQIMPFAKSNFTWTVQGDVEWATVTETTVDETFEETWTDGVTTTAHKAVEIMVTPNTEYRRSGTLTVTAQDGTVQTFPIEQTGLKADAEVTCEAAESGLEFASAGESLTVLYTTNMGDVYDYSATYDGESSGEWLSWSDEGAGQVVLTASEWTSKDQDRTAVFTIHVGTPDTSEASVEIAVRQLRVDDYYYLYGASVPRYATIDLSAQMYKKEQDIYAFDLNVFRKNRTEFQRTQPLSESSCDDGTEQGESMSALLKKFSSALSVCDKYSFQSDPRFAWVDEMENDELYRKIISLPERDIDLLTLIAFEGYSQREVAEIRGIAPAAICKKIAKLKKLLYGG